LILWQSTHEALNSVLIAEVKTPRELQLAVITLCREMDSPFWQLPPYGPNEVSQAHTHLKSDRNGSTLIVARELKRGPRSRTGI
jgi:hypothetical protein